MSMNGWTSCSRPTDLAAEVIRCIDRPARQTRRPQASAARMTLSTRATLEAKQPTATLPFSEPISSARATFTSASDPATPSTKTLVESHTIASTPSSPRRRMVSTSVRSPMTGSASIFQSPVCSTVPSGVLIASPLGSGIEWVMVTKVTSKSPSLIEPPSSTSFSSTSSSRPASRSFSRIRKAVNGVA